jgi:hypothetical protein
MYWSRCVNYSNCRYLNLERKHLINCTLGLADEKSFGRCGFGIDKRDEILDDHAYRIECRKCEEKLRDQRVANYWWNK